MLNSVQEESMQDIPLGLTLEEARKRYILNTLEEHNGNKSKAAKQLGISLRGLYYQITRPPGRRVRRSLTAQSRPEVE